MVNNWHLKFHGVQQQEQSIPILIIDPDHIIDYSSSDSDH